MDYQQVDSLMKKVERCYHNDFIINGNETLSRQYAEKLIRKESNRFYGDNGLFSINKMQCDNKCKKSGGEIVLTPGGVVYGPYYTFPAGGYTAAFHTSGESKCMFSVETQELGMLASCEDFSGIVEVNFSLSSTAKNLEFKVKNIGNTPVTFTCVKVSARSIPKGLPILSKNECPSEWLVDCDDTGRMVSYQRQSLIQLREMSRLAECELPGDTRLRRVKKALLRVIKSFTREQVLFNQATVKSMQAMQNQMKGLMVLKEDVEELSRKIDGVKQELKDVSDRCEGLTDSVSLLDSRLNGLEADEKLDPVALSGLWDKIGELEQKLSRICDAYDSLHQKCCDETGNHIRKNSSD